MAGMVKADTIDMFSDASRSEILEFGAVCQDSWTFPQWPDSFIKSCNSSIAYLELYALVVGVKIWIKRFRNRRIVLVCDNQSVVNMVNHTTSSCKNLST